MEREVEILRDLPLSSLLSSVLNAAINAQAAAALTTVNFIERVGFINKSDKRKGIFDKPKAESGDVYDVRVARLNMEKKEFVPAVLAAPPIGEAAFPDGMHAAVVANDPVGLGAAAAANDGTPAHVAGLPKFVPAVAHADAFMRTTSEKIELPFVAMTSIPTFEVNQLDWDFNVKLNSIEQFETEFTHSDTTTVDADSNFSLNLGKFLSIGNSMKVQTTVKNDFALRYGSSHEAEYNLKIAVKANAGRTPVGIERLLGIAEKIATNNELANAKMATAK
jgi:hypothetical protein